MVVFAIVVLGYVSLGKLPVDLYPKIDIPYVTVIATYPGTGPQEIETLISKPIEDSVSTISGVKNVTSTSEEGVSVVSIEFYLGTDLNTATNDVREKVDAARMQLPRDMDPPVIQKFSISAMPVLSFALASPRPPRELRHIADDVVKDRLGKLEGVGSVEVAGGDVREILVAVDKGALEGYKLTINDVVQALQTTNLNLPSGSVKEGRREYAVRVVGEFQSPEEIKDVRLNTRTGKTIYLADIATVSDTVAERRGFTRVDSVDSVAVTVLKQSDANTVQVCDAARRELTKLTGQTFDVESKEVKGVPKPSGRLQALWFRIRSPAPVVRQAGVLPQDITCQITVDQSTFIRHSLSDLQHHLILGSLFAVLVVFIFLHNFRGTLIVALAIPTSIIATFTPLLIAGFSVNMMSMLGLSLCVGILVDDSIVVIENIYRHLRMGEEPREAAFNGRTEIGLAAITITMVDVVVFVPIAFMGGIVGQFFRQFGLTVAFATLFSLFVSFTMTPMLSSRWFRKEEALPSDEGEAGEVAAPRSLIGQVFAGFDYLYIGLREWYRSILAWALDHRLVTVLTGIVSLLACVAIAAPGTQKHIFDLLPAITVPGKAKMGFAIGIVILSLIGVIWGGRGGRLPMAAVAAVSVLVALFAYKPLGVEFFPRIDQGRLTTTVELPAGSSLAATDAVVHDVESYILDKQRFPEVESIFAEVGGSNVANATIRIVLLDKTERKRSDLQIVDALQQFTGNIPGANIKTTSYEGMGGPQQAPITIELSGNDTAELVSLAARIERKVAGVPGTLNVDTTWRVGKPEIRAEIDRDRAADRSTSTYQVASALRTSLEGDTTSKFREGSTQYDVRVRLRELDRQSVAEISNLIVGYNSGAIYLGDVAKVSLSTGPTKIDRKNRQRMVAVESDLERGYASANVEGAIKRAIAEMPLGNVALKFGGESQEREESFGNTGAALALSVVLIYILMAALFEGYLSPFIIMFALPMALVGALLAIIVTGKTLSLVTMIGIIMLMGLVTKNAILLVDYTNTLRSRGLDRRAALLEAGPTRLRPILMTTLAMIFGMLPIALAVARGGEWRAPMAIAVIGGLILSTMLTLLVIPVLYTVFDNVAGRLMRVLNWALRRVVP
jgi:HAE1 family hydrophobic/amphiphilic exporter-1